MSVAATSTQALRQVQQFTVQHSPGSASEFATYRYEWRAYHRLDATRPVETVEFFSKYPTAHSGAIWEFRKLNPGWEVFSGEDTVVQENGEYTPF